MYESRARADTDKAIPGIEPDIQTSFGLLGRVQDFGENLSLEISPISPGAGDL